MLEAAIVVENGLVEVCVMMLAIVYGHHFALAMVVRVHSVVVTKSIDRCH